MSPHWKLIRREPQMWALGNTGWGVWYSEPKRAWVACGPDESVTACRGVEEAMKKAEEGADDLSRVR